MGAGKDRKRIMLIVVALGGGVVGFDALVIRAGGDGHDAAGAPSDNVSPGGVGSPDGRLPALDSTPTHTTRLAGMLRAGLSGVAPGSDARGPGVVPDVFSVERVAPIVETDLLAEAQAEDPGAIAQAFASRHTLRSVLTGGVGESAARITGPRGDRTLRLGDEVSGFTLSEIRATSVLLVRGAARVELSLLPVQAPASSGD